MITIQEMIQNNTMNDDEVLNFTQAIRKDYVENLIKHSYPTDEYGINAFLSVLSDMDRVAVNKKKLGASEKQTAADLLVARTLSQLSSSLDGVNPFERQVKEGNIPKVDNSKIPEVNPVPGELSIGLDNTNYTDLMKKFD